jgi:hypothetical protein
MLLSQMVLGLGPLYIVCIKIVIVCKVSVYQECLLSSHKSEVDVGETGNHRHGLVWE